MKIIETIESLTELLVGKKEVHQQKKARKVSVKTKQKPKKKK